MELSGISQEHPKPTISEKYSTEPSESRPAAPRRPRVREVSSRFMTPIASSSSGDLHLAALKCPLPKHSLSIGIQSKQGLRKHPSPGLDSEPPNSEAEQQQPLCCTDENRPETVQSLDTPLGLHSKFSMQKKRAVKAFKENGEQKPENSKLVDGLHLKSINGRYLGRSVNLGRTRMDTPVIHGTDRIRPRSVFTSQNFPRPTNNAAVASVATTEAAKLVLSMGAKKNGIQENGHVQGNTFSSESSTCVSSSCSDIDNVYVENTDDSSSLSNFSESPPISDRCHKSRPFSDIRSSMPEVDLLPTMSARLLADEGSSGQANIVNESCKISASPCHRSLNFSSTNSICRTSVLSKSHSSSTNVGGLCLPPHPSNSKLAMDVKKGRKGSGHQENVFSLRLLYNHYLQWRFVNANTDAVMHAQRIGAESSLHGVGGKISELRDSVTRKQTEFERLKKIRSLSTIIEAQMPYLDEWTALEGDYSSSLSGVVKALEDASLRLPIIGNVRADIREIGEALNSATNMLEAIFPSVRRFLPKAEGMDNVISELAGVVSIERALIEECGDLLSTAHMLQVCFRFTHHTVTVHHFIENNVSEVNMTTRVNIMPRLAILFGPWNLVWPLKRHSGSIIAFGKNLLFTQLIPTKAKRS